MHLHFFNSAVIVNSKMDYSVNFDKFRDISAPILEC